MTAREGADESLKELGALKERHQTTRDRASRLAEEMEIENKAIRDLLNAYKQADDAVRRSRGL